MNILILTNEIPPMTNANSMIANNLAVGFSNEENVNTVDLISIEYQNTNSFMTKKINYDSIKFRFYKKTELIYKDKISEKNKLKKILYVLSNIKLFLYYIFKILNFKKYLFARKFIKVYSKRKYDFVICISNPIETIDYLIKLNYTANIVWYQLDPYYENYRLTNNKDIFEKEKYYLSKSSLVLVPEWNYSNYLDKFPQEFHTRISSVGLPLDLSCDFDQIKLNASRLTFAYIGSFYKEIREPNRMLEFLNNLFIDNDYSFIYAGKNFSYIENYIKKLKLNHLKRKIINLGSIDSCYANSLIKKVDVLINIDNLISNQVPSKLIQYMFTKNFILNFGNHHSKYSKSLLDEYPKHFNVNQYTKITNAVIDFKEKFFELSNIDIKNHKFLDIHTFEYIKNTIFEKLKLKKEKI